MEEALATGYRKPARSVQLAIDVIGRTPHPEMIRAHAKENTAICKPIAATTPTRTAKHAAIVKPFAAMPDETVIGGEIVALD